MTSRNIAKVEAPARILKRYGSASLREQPKPPNGIRINGDANHQTTRTHVEIQEASDIQDEHDHELKLAYALVLEEIGTRTQSSDVSTDLRKNGLSWVTPSPSPPRGERVGRQFHVQPLEYNENNTRTLTNTSKWRTRSFTRASVRSQLPNSILDSHNSLRIQYEDDPSKNDTFTYFYENTVLLGYLLVYESRQSGQGVERVNGDASMNSQTRTGYAERHWQEGSQYEDGRNGKLLRTSTSQIWAAGFLFAMHE
ncbi:hypothetical protein BJ508DRAFT_315495 [Ascobolus immersus RN42]|uniref:Uncharacterized protein n=1 Tax=Ascobolus immersus RN42 TaxID=1160509 RepID=A0A3N4HAJ7_ASCIM|nr:hypothetical protein BJ508DRAFT_315495 [Ascobolus immersus RN42]